MHAPRHSNTGCSDNAQHGLGHGTLSACQRVSDSEPTAIPDGRVCPGSIRVYEGESAAIPDGRVCHIAARGASKVIGLNSYFVIATRSLHVAATNSQPQVTPILNKPG